MTSDEVLLSELAERVMRLEHGELSRIVKLEKEVERLTMQRDTLNANQDAMLGRISDFIALSPDDESVRRMIAEARRVASRVDNNENMSKAAYAKVHGKVRDLTDLVHGEIGRVDEILGRSLPGAVERIQVLEGDSVKLRRKLRKLKRSVECDHLAELAK